MPQSFTVTMTRHKVFGLLATLSVSGQPARRFTKEEALIVSRALEAVARGASSERLIYMSPIASDCDLDARVGEGGVIIASDGCRNAALDWSETRALAQELARFGSASPQEVGVLG